MQPEKIKIDQPNIQVLEPHDTQRIDYRAYMPAPGDHGPNTFVADVPLMPEDPLQEARRHQPVHGRLRKAIASVVLGTTIAVPQVREGVIDLVHQAVAAAEQEAPGFPNVSADDYPEVAVNMEEFSFMTVPNAPEVVADISRAVAADSCETEVTATEVASVYERLYGESGRPSDDESTFQSQAMQAIDAFAESRSRLHFVAVPSAEFQKLNTDAFSENPNLPIQDYRNMISTQLNGYGIEAVFEWDPEADDAPRKDVIEPHAENAQSGRVFERQAIMQMVRDLMGMPVEAIPDAANRRVVFGNILDEGAAASVDSSTNDMYVDIAFEELVTGPSTTTHEVNHWQQFDICSKLIQESKGDPAFNALNRTFRYEETVTDDERMQQLDGPLYAPIFSSDSSIVVVAEDYGATNHYEDGSTIAEMTYFGPGAGNIYQAEGIQDVTILKEKQAYLMARLAAMSPDLAEYYMSQMHVARIMEKAFTQAADLTTQYNTMMEEHPELIPGEADPALRAQHAEIGTRSDDYYYLANRMADVLDPAPTIH